MNILVLYASMSYKYKKKKMKTIIFVGLTTEYMRKTTILALLLLSLAGVRLRADEGMWLPVL